MSGSTNTWAVVCGLGLLLAACSSETGNPADAAGAGGAGMPEAMTCGGKATPYKVGLEAEGQNGMFKVRFASADPSPPQRYTNSWVLEVRSTANELMPGMGLKVFPFMPLHGHGTRSVHVEPGDEQGQYTADPYLPMAGHWKVGVGVYDPEAGDKGAACDKLASKDNCLDYADFNLCIPE